MGFSYFCSAEFIRCPSTLGTPEGQLEQASAPGTVRRALRGPCIVCWQDGINPYIISVLLSSGTAAGQAAGLLPRGRLLPISVVNTYERSYEGEGLAIGGQYGWVDNATRWHKECETYQRQPKQGGDDCYQQLHPRAVVSFHRRLKLEQNEHVFFKKNKIKQNFSKLFLVLATIWNARSASGTAAGYWNAPWRYWNAALRLLVYVCAMVTR